MLNMSPQLGSAVSAACVLLLLASRCLTNISLPLWLDAFSTNATNSTSLSLEFIASPIATDLPLQLEENQEVQGVNHHLNHTTKRIDPHAGYIFSNTTGNTETHITKKYHQSTEFSIYYSSYITNNVTRDIYVSYNSDSNTTDHVTLPFFTAAFPTAFVSVFWMLVLPLTSTACGTTSVHRV